MSLGKKKMLSQGASAAPTPVGTDNFNTVLYTGNGGTQSVTGVGFQPDFVWAKRRSTAEDNVLFDSVRGVQNQIVSNKTNAESTKTNALSSFDSNGFTTGANNALNTNNQTYVAWNWYAPTSETNTIGTDTATIKKNVDAGFSIVNFTSSGTTNVGHGLDGAPDLIWLKGVNAAEDWQIYHSDLGTGKYMSFSKDGGDEAVVSRADSFSSVTSTTFTNRWTSGSVSWVAYCFKNVSGYQKVGSYNGSGSSLNTISVGFQPRLVLFKRTNSTGSWRIFDSTRGTDKSITANSNGAEYDDTQNYVDFTSDGFEFNRTVTQQNPDLNSSSGIYIYLAIA